MKNSIFKSLFSLGGDDDREEKYVEHISFDESCHGVLEYHYLILNRNGEPKKINVKRYKKCDYNSRTINYCTVISSKMLSLGEYEKVYGITLEEVKKIFSIEENIIHYGESPYMITGETLLYYHEFSGLGITLCYEFNMNLDEPEDLNVIKIERF
jgi:hypothetical protein